MGKATQKRYSGEFKSRVALEARYECVYLHAFETGSKLRIGLV